MRLIRTCVMLFAATGFAVAEDPAPDPEAKETAEPAAEVKPSVERLDESRFKVGKITFDQKTREIRFPAVVNMTDGLLEFAIVHENGKIHESLLHTNISPLHLNIAFKLLRFPASRELYLLPNERGGLSDEFPEVPDDVKRGARILISVEWDDAGRKRKVPINEWIQHAVKGSTMPSGPWVYGGSDVYDGKFAAESTGDIAAIFITNASLINYPGDDNRDDTVWLPYPKRVPEVGTNVEVIIAPQTNAHRTTE